MVLHDRVAVRSGHGVGKSALVAWVILWWLLTRGPAKVAVTAPTAHQLSDVLWAEIGKWHRKLPEYFRAQLTVTSDAVTLTEAPTMNFAVARTARKEVPETFQGYHSENMLFIADEASGVEDIIFQVGEGAMSTKGAKTLLTGNPTRSSGYFHSAFHQLRDRWETFKVGCADSSQVSSNYANDMAKRYGTESNIYRVRVQGEFPLSEDDVVVPLYLVESAIVREIQMIKSMRPIWGLDVARFGDDRSALAKRQGNYLLEPVKSWHGKDLMQTVGMVVDEGHNTDKDWRPGEILVDVIGMGGGVVDRLRELDMPGTHIRGINVGESRSSDAKDRYMRLRDQIWFKCNWFEAADCKIPEDEQLVAELTIPKYAHTSSGKLQVEGKSDMKKRGLRSPDLADAFILTFASYGITRKDGEFDAYARSYARRLAEQRRGFGGGRTHWST